jgi:hypothetical protein
MGFHHYTPAEHYFMGYVDQKFGGTKSYSSCCSLLHTNCLPHSLALRMEAVIFSETLAKYFQTTRHLISENGVFFIHHFEKLNSAQMQLVQKRNKTFKYENN